jgi:hypothetical protein
MNTTQQQGSTEKALHDSAVQARSQALSIAQTCGCIRCASFVDAMSRAGYASQSPDADAVPSGSQPAEGFPKARPGLRPGEGLGPYDGDGRMMSPVEIGRMSHTEQVDQAVEFMRRQGG